MGLFRRARRDSAANAIGAFWAWWQAEGAVATAEAIATGDPRRAAPELSRRVAAIDGGLAWELAPGHWSEHTLVVTCAGDPDLRGVARRWRRASPGDGPVWEFSDARRAAAHPETVVLSVDGVDIDVASAVAGAQMAGTSLDLAIHHPAYADLRADQRDVVTYMLLDCVLGEAAVETWVGTVGSPAGPPVDPVSMMRLRTVVRDLAERFTDASGAPVWVLLDGQASNGARVIASAQVPLRAAAAPDLDTHVAVRVPFSHLMDDGLPDAGSLQPLRDFEQHLNARLGASGRVVAHETRSGIRLLHTYVDGTTPAVDQLAAVIGGWDQGRVNMTVTRDPAWHQVRHLRAAS